MYNYLKYDVKEKFQKVDETCKEKTLELQRISREIYFYKLLLDMAMSGISFSNIRLMLDEDINSYEVRKINQELLNSNKEVVSKVLNVDLEKVTFSYDAINKNIIASPSVIRSKDDIEAANNAFRCLEDRDSGMEEMYALLEDYEEKIKQGMTVDDIGNMIRREYDESNDKVNKKVATLCLLKYNDNKKKKKNN